MGSIKILHTADLHLASSFRGLPPHIGQQRRKDLMQTLARLTDICRNQQIDLLLIAGDLWEQENITRPLVDFIADQFSKIPATKIIIAPGRSDSKYEESFYGNYPWPENVHIFSEGMTCLACPNLNLRIYGMAWSANESAAPDWSRLAADAANGSQILILAFGNPESLSIPEWIMHLDNLAYLALGGEHRYVLWGDKAYDPGCPEPLDFSDPDICGVLTGTIGETCAVEIIPTNSRQFHQLEISVDKCKDFAECVELIEKELAPYEPDNNLFALRLTGIRPQGEWDISKMRQMLNAFYVSLRDDTETYYDVNTLEEEHSRGVLGKYISAVKNADCDEKVIKQALSLGLDALLAGRVTPW